MPTNGHFNQSAFLGGICGLENALAKLSSENQSTAQDGARWFMRAIYDAGRMLHQRVDWAQLPEWRGFIEKSAPILSKQILEFSRFYLDSTDLLEREWEWGEEWLRVCRDWSSAQFMRDLYGEKLDRPFHYFSEDDDYLDDLRAQGEKHGPVRPEEIPPGIPASHWWWWYPEQK